MIRARIEVCGVIQGVGFRPFIYRLANEQGLTGYVANTAAGVTIEVDGTDRQIDNFIETIASHKPPLAAILASASGRVHPLAGAPAHRSKVIALVTTCGPARSR